MVKFGNLGFSIGKSENCGFFQKLLQPVTWKLVDADNLFCLWRYVSIEGQGHLLTLAQGHLHMNITTCFCLETTGHFNQILYVSFQVQGNENLLIQCWSHDQDGRHAYIYGKNPSKIFFSGSSWPISLLLGM